MAGDSFAQGPEVASSNTTIVLARTIMVFVLALDEGPGGVCLPWGMRIGPVSMRQNSGKARQHPLVAFSTGSPRAVRPTSA